MKSLNIFNEISKRVILYRMLLFVMTITASGQASAKKKDHLHQCWEKQAKPLTNRYLSFNFEEAKNNLDHNFKPWQTTHYDNKGHIWSNATVFMQADSTQFGSKIYTEKEQLNDSELLVLPYGSQKPLNATLEMLSGEKMGVARYSPTRILNDFEQKHPIPDRESDRDYSVYKLTVDERIVKLYIRNTDNLVAKIATLQNDQLLGDVQTVYHYSNYFETEGLYYPSFITIDKYNSKIK